MKASIVGFVDLSDQQDFPKEEKKMGVFQVKPVAEKSKILKSEIEKTFSLDSILSQHEVVLFENFALLSNFREQFSFFSSKKPRDYFAQKDDFYMYYVESLNLLRSLRKYDNGRVVPTTLSAYDKGIQTLNICVKDLVKFTNGLIPTRDYTLFWEFVNVHRNIKTLLERNVLKSLGPIEIGRFRSEIGDLILKDDKLKLYLQVYGLYESESKDVGFVVRKPIFIKQHKSTLNVLGGSNFSLYYKPMDDLGKYNVF